MEFTNEFMIPRPVDETFAVLTDLERVAPCMPGATLESVDGDEYTGRVKVKVGPMSLTYQGTATLTEQDPVNHTASIRAEGREKRGAGTATADVHAVLADKDGQTLVTVTTDIAITGKPAQFGRGVMADVGAKIIDRFADNLRDEFESDGAEEPPATPAATSEVAEPSPAVAALADASGPREVAYRAPRDEALDIMDVAGQATAKRVAPLVAVALAVLAFVFLRRRGGADEG